MDYRYFLVTFRLNKHEEYFDSLCEVFKHNTDLAEDKEAIAKLEAYMNKRMGSGFKCTVFNVSDITYPLYEHYRREIEYPF